MIDIHADTTNSGSEDNKAPIEAYSRWITETPESWPEEALHSAHREFIDTVAVMLPGAVEPATLNAYHSLSKWSDGPTSAVGFMKGLPTPWAALVNGTAGHALDLDDNFDPPKAHASTVLVPALLALGEQEKTSGARCLDAYIVGLQIMGRVGQGVNPAHRNRGWHATATIGTIGAAAACARLLKLDTEQTAMALSLSTSMSAGFMSQFGTMAKPLHAGLAARNGVMAAGFAQEGMSASLNTFDSKTGLNHLMVGPDYEHLRDTLTHVEHGQNLRFETESIGDPLMILDNGFRVKRFANCGAAHRAMDAVLHLLDQHSFHADDVDHIDVYAPRVHFNNLMYKDPQNGLQSKFSIEYALAVCLATGGCQLSDFTNESVTRPHVQALMPKIRRQPVDKLEGEFPTHIDIHLKDGRTLTEERAWPLGSKWKPFSDADYWNKFMNCAHTVLHDDQIAPIRETLEHLRTLNDIIPLTQSLRWQQQGDHT